jgi:hypothetical protein
MAKVKILNSCAGQGFSFHTGQIIEVTKINSDVLHSKVRHGTAILIEEEKKKNVDEGRGSNESTDIRNDSQIKRKGRKRFSESKESGIL